MPHFFMHLRQGSDVIQDLEGEDFPSLSAARVSAIASAREIMSDRVGKGQEPNDSAIVIADDDGHIAMVVYFVEAIDRPRETGGRPPSA